MALIPLQIEQISPFSAEAIKQLLSEKQIALNQLFFNHADIEAVLTTRSAWIDLLLQTAWQHFQLHLDSSLTLIAVGGYGLGRLHPGSDIDLLILTTKPIAQEHQSLAAFIAFCWDCGLRLGASTRTLVNCEQLAKDDVQIFTNLLTHRFLCGKMAQYDQLAQLIAHQTMWPFERFLLEKIKERQMRYARVENEEYRLEPSLKDSPGTLRDIDLIRWLCLLRYQTQDFACLVENSDITDEDFQKILEMQTKLWRLRYLLHTVSNASNDRLFFEYQEMMAKSESDSNNAKNLNVAVSSLMQSFYEIAREVRNITTLLCQHFNEITHPTAFQHPIGLPSEVAIAGQYLEITDGAILHRRGAIFELLNIIIDNELKGFTAKSRRIIQQYPFSFEQAEPCFLKLLHHADKAAKALKLMHQYGLLVKYIPDFKQITAQMQFDLYHVYTVDAHTLKLIDYIADLLKPEQFNQLPIKTDQITINHETLVLAGLFHDIAKGLGGNHSTRGAIITKSFCDNHAISKQQTELIAWLVEHHLLMSHVSQKQDIHSDNVILSFIKEVNTVEKLIHLYLLTVADIQATNPSLWNHWRKTLLTDLLVSALTLLDSSLLHQVSKPSLSLNLEDYAAKLQGNQRFVVEAKHHKNKLGIEITIYAPNRTHLLSTICSTLEQQSLTITTARLQTTDNGYVLQHYIIMPIAENGSFQNTDLVQIQKTIEVAINDIETIQSTRPLRHLPRIAQHAAKHIKIKVHSLQIDGKTMIEVVAPDFPGLLARIAAVFDNFDIRLSYAKINTYGSRVEDVFFIEGPVEKNRLDQTLKSIERNLSL